MSVAQSFGICVPASIAARMIEVPSGTVTLWPSMVSVTVFSDLESGVPKSISWINDMAIVLLFRSLQARGGRAKIFPEMFKRAHDGVGREAAQRAERAEFHGVAEVSDDGDILRPAVPSANLVDGLATAGRADPAGRALAAGLDGAKLHRETRLLPHADAVVEHHDAAMADQAVACREGLIVERRVEQRTGKIGPKWSANLHGTNRTSCTGTAADIVDQFAQRDAEGDLEQPAMLDVARELDRHGAAGTAHAEIGIGFRATGQDERNCRE